jgi:hypothetical protein
MMRPETYALLFEALAHRGVYLINDPDEFKHCHHFPEWLPELQHITPKTTVLPLTSADDLTPAKLEKCLDSFGNAAVIVKDFVKSEKHHWNEACYIANAADTDEALRVARNFLNLRGADLEGGLVFRRFETFRELGAHPKSGMPLTEEFRAFVLDGKIMYLMNYWDELEYPEKAPDIEAVLPAVARIRSRFFTVDFARLGTGDWMVVELGDGQVAGLTDEADLDAFYQALSSAESNFQVKPQIRARIKLLATAEGGRKEPLLNEPRCPVKFDGKDDGEYNDCMFRLPSPVQPGETFDADIFFLCPDLVAPFLNTGRRFWLHEGVRPFAEGQVIEVYRKW